MLFLLHKSFRWFILKATRYKTTMEKYITKEEYLQAKGINLEIELEDDDNKSNKVKRFIHEVTDWCLE